MISECYPVMGSIDSTKTAWTRGCWSCLAHAQFAEKTSRLWRAWQQQQGPKNTGQRRRMKIGFLQSRQHILLPQLPRHDLRATCTLPGVDDAVSEIPTHLRRGMQHQFTLRFPIRIFNPQFRSHVYFVFAAVQLLQSGTRSLIWIVSRFFDVDLWTTYHVHALFRVLVCDTPQPILD